MLGVGITPLGNDEILQVLTSAVSNGKKGYVCVTGVHGVMEAQKDPTLRTIINHSLVTAPDGRPTVWVGRLQGFSAVRQLTGPNLMLRLCSESVTKGYTHFFYGGDVGVAQELKTCLERRYPGLRVVGTYTPPFRGLTTDEENELVAQVAAVKPDFFWVGLSTPKQEQFMPEYLPKLDAKVMIGVGAAFDIHTGRIQDSPEWFKALGLQWVHRLYQDPKRLWRRYLYNNPRFLVRVAFQLLGFRRYELA